MNSLNPKHNPLLQNQEFLSTLTPRIREIAIYAFENPDASMEKIGKHFGITRQRVGQMLRSNRVLAAHAELSRRKVKSLTAKAVHKYEKLMDQNENLEVARKVSERVLTDQKVLDAPKPIQINVFQQASTTELKRIVEERRIDVSDAVDAELSDDE